MILFLSGPLAYRWCKAFFVGAFLGIFLFGLIYHYGFVVTRPPDVTEIRLSKIFCMALGPYALIICAQAWEKRSDGALRDSLRHPPQGLAG